MAKKIKQFPQIYRIITAIVVILILALLSVNVGFLVTDYVEKKRKEEEMINKLLTEKENWERIKDRYPDYRDAYFQLAQIEYRLDNTLKAGEYVEKALSIDPNYKPAIELKSQLESSSE